MINDVDAIFWLTLTVYYEARGECVIGQKNVAKVILNRAKLRDWPVSDIVLARKQFSCYNKGLTNKLLWIRNIPKFIEIHGTVKVALDEWRGGDNLKMATHYFSIKGMIGYKPPYWASSMQYICEIEDHRFFREL